MSYTLTRGRKSPEFMHLKNRCHPSLAIQGGTPSTMVDIKKIDDRGFNLGGGDLRGLN